MDDFDDGDAYTLIKDSVSRIGDGGAYTGCNILDTCPKCNQIRDCFCADSTIIK